MRLSLPLAVSSIRGLRGPLIHSAAALLALGCLPPPGAAAVQRGMESGPSAPPAGASGAFLSSLESGVLDELNDARTDPRGYARLLEERLSWFDDRVMREPGSGVAVETREGAAAVREAIAVLRAMQPRPAVAVSSGMSAGARDHVRDQGRTGATGHAGRDGTDAAERVARYGAWHESISENITYGPPTARDVVIGLLVDDGVATRGHRRNLLDPGIRVVGVACGEHPRFRRMCVIVHAGGFSENGR